MRKILYNAISKVTGPAIIIKPPPTAINTYDNVAEDPIYYFPFDEDVSFTAAQSYVPPIPSMFGGGKAILNGISKDIAVGDAVEATANVIQDGFGLKFFNRFYYASAWNGASPSTLDVTINLSMGMLDLWSGKEEVFDPIITLMQMTLPYPSSYSVYTWDPNGGMARSGDGMIKAPGPNGLEVYAAFISHFNLFKSGIFGEEELNNARNINKSAMKNVWAVGFGSGGKKEGFIYYGDMIVSSATHTFSNKLDDKGYPIYGSIRLSFRSQTIAVRSDFMEGGEESLTEYQAELQNRQNKYGGGR